MQFLGSPFCSVCIEGTIERIHSLANPIVSYIPSDTNISTPTFPIELELEMTEPVPNTFKRRWVLNDSIVDMNIDSILIAENELNLGTNILTVFIEDTTELLRVDDHENLHIYSVSWIIENTPVQNIEIPDTAFLHALIDEGVDANGDSLISYPEAEAIISLNVSGRGITDITGIEAFVNLDTLDCSSNSLTSLDISNNPALKGLYIQDNQIDSLDVSGNTALHYLSFGGNRLASLDVTNNISLRSLSIDEMPTLFEVCVWELPFPPEGVEIDTRGSPNVCFETDCDGTCSTTGINTNSPTGMSIYPNPTSNILTIEIVQPGHHSIEITSLNGQLLFSDKNEGPTHQIDLSSFQKGVYFITVRTSDYVKTEKIIKQ
jgi:Leucine-rich repeat (LRR) protein